MKIKIFKFMGLFTFFMIFLMGGRLLTFKFKYPNLSYEHLYDFESMAANVLFVSFICAIICRHSKWFKNKE